MDLLNKKNWIVYFILFCATGGLINIFIAWKLGLLKENAWYKNSKYWIIGFIALIFPVFIMLAVLNLQMIIKIAYKLRVPGDYLYTSIYYWIICLMVPVVGWILFAVMLIYIIVWTNINILRKMGED